MPVSPFISFLLLTIKTKGNWTWKASRCRLKEKFFLHCLLISTTCNVDSRVCVGLANLCRFAPSTDFGSPQFWQNSKVAITSLPREWSCHERKLCSNDHITFSVYKVSTPYGQICKGGVSVERHLTDRGRYNIRQLPCSMSTDWQFRTRSWTSSSSIQKWHFSHTCCTMEAKEEVRRVYLWELGFGFVSLHLPDLWELVAPEWFRPAQDSLSASLSISISEIVGLVSLWQIPQMEILRFALHLKINSDLACPA